VKFIDEATIYVKSGDGGRGCVSFRREKFIPRGGPDGGDGGKGGDVSFKTSSQKRTLYQFQHKKHYHARNGSGGLGKKKTGKNGPDIEIIIPAGTLVKKADTGELIKDFTTPNETYCIAKGGIGGRGNARFKSSTHRTPRFAQPGEPGESLTLKLELKLLADVGIIGFPNAGKTTLIRALTSARPKVGNYPFTTLTPNLGVAMTSYSEPFVMADVPGLIAGAHEGTGLGIQFLKHIERTRFLIHLIDASAIDINKPLEGYQAINNELNTFSKKLLEKPQIIVLNKLDLANTREPSEIFQTALNEKHIECISAETGKGIDQLMGRIETQLAKINDES